MLLMYNSLRLQQPRSGSEPRTTTLTIEGMCTLLHDNKEEFLNYELISTTVVGGITQYYFGRTSLCASALMVMTHCR